MYLPPSLELLQMCIGICSRSQAILYCRLLTQVLFSEKFRFMNVSFVTQKNVQVFPSLKATLPELPHLWGDHCLSFLAELDPTLSSVFETWSIPLTCSLFMIHLSRYACQKFAMIQIIIMYHNKTKSYNLTPGPVHGRQVLRP